MEKYKAELEALMTAISRDGLAALEAAEAFRRSGGKPAGACGWSADGDALTIVVSQHPRQDVVYERQETYRRVIRRAPDGSSTSFELFLVKSSFRKQANEALMVSAQ